MPSMFQVLSVRDLLLFLERLGLRLRLGYDEIGAGFNLGIGDIFGVLSWSRKSPLHVGCKLTGI